MGRSWHNCWKCGGRSESEVCVICGTFAEDDPLVGSIVGGYELTMLLAHEVDALLYKARDSGHEAVVVRITPRSLWGNALANSRFDEARRRHEFVKHPGVSPVIGGGSTVDGAAFYVMEWGPGTTLSDHLRGKPKPPPIVRAIDMGIQMAEALAAIHDVGVYHGRISPYVFRNLSTFEGSSDWMRLIHTGTSGSLRHAAGLVPNPQWRGDPIWKTYQRRSDSTEGVSADVLGLVATFYHLLTGGRPFLTGRTGSARLVDPQQWRPDLLHNRKLVRILERGLSAKTREHFDTAVEFRGALKLAQKEAKVSERRLSGTRAAKSGTKPRLAAVSRGVRRPPAATPRKKRSRTGTLPVVERPYVPRAKTGSRGPVRPKTGQRKPTKTPVAPTPELTPDEMADQIFAALGQSSKPTPRTPAAAPKVIPEVAQPEVTPKPSDVDDEVFGAPEPPRDGVPYSTGLTEGVAAQLLALGNELRDALMRDVAKHGRFEITDLSLPIEPTPPDSDALFGA